MFSLLLHLADIPSHGKSIKNGVRGWQRNSTSRETRRLGVGLRLCSKIAHWAGLVAGARRGGGVDKEVENYSGEQNCQMAIT
jgi:hypothetical protein